MAYRVWHPGALVEPGSSGKFVFQGGYYVIEVAAAGNVVEAPAGAITYVGQAPSVVTTENHISEIPAGAIAYVGQAPTIDDGAALGNISQVPAGAIAYTGLAPAVVTTEKHIAEVPAGAIAYTGLAPTIDDGTPDPSTVQVPVGAIAYTGHAPTIDDGETPPVPYDVSWKGGGRIQRKGSLPKWWEDEEEPQPQEVPESDSSTKERLAELAAGLPIPKDRPKAPVVELPRKKPAPAKKPAPPERPAPAPKVEEPPDELEVLKREVRRQAKKMKRLEKAIAALLLLRNTRRR